MEKQQAYERAAECYERAWKLEFEASAPAGFKLAFCYMKARPPRYVDAIDICETVLAQYVPPSPSLPRSLASPICLCLCLSCTQANPRLFVPPATLQVPGLPANPRRDPQKVHGVAQVRRGQELSQ